jgi:Ca2+-binding RTX toxin-like protein
MVKNGEISRIIQNNDDGSRKDSLLDPNNTHPYDELDITKGADGKVAAQVALDPRFISAGVSIGQVFGSALGSALGGKDQLGKLVGGVAGGAIGGLIGQKFAQVLATSMTVDLSKVSVADVFAGQNLDITAAGIGAVASFLTAEIGSVLKIGGFGDHLFNAAANGFTVSVLTQVATKINAGLTFDAAIAAISWGDAVAGAAKGVDVSIAGILGGYLGHELVPAQTKEGAVGGQLLGAVGSAIGLLFGETLGFGLNFIVPGLGSLIGTVLGTLIGDHFGNTPHPAAIDLVDQAGYLYGSSHYQVSEGGSYNSPDQMAAATDAIINAYLSAVKGAALDHSKQTWVGYVTDPDFRYVNGAVPAHKYLSFINPDDAVHAAALDVLQNLEVIGGDLLLKRAHHNSASNVRDPGPEWNGLTAASAESGAEKLVIMSADLRVAQDYENYLNNREAINAVMAANPDSSFTAGWIATFARVNDLGLNHLNGSDFLGGLVGYLDSVNKSGLGFAAANATVKPGSASNVLVEARVANWIEVPGSLSAFADQTNVSSDSAGQTVQLAFNNSTLLALGFHFVASAAPGGDGSNDIWFGGNGGQTFNGSGGNDILTGGAANDTIHGGAGWDFIDGGAGADTLYGEDGGDILRGGAGNDTLLGGGGDDTYVFNRGDGVDRVIDNVTTTTHLDAGTDTLLFGPGIRAVDITTTSDGSSLIATVHDPANPNAQDIVILQNGADPKDRIEFFKFADGSILNEAGTGPNTIVIETAGSAKLTQVGNNYFFNTAGTGSPLKYNGAAITPGLPGDFALIGAEQIAGGYEVAWRNPTTDQYIAWSMDANGNYNGTILGVVPGGSLALKMLETSFHQDLNGDGRIGVVTTVIDAAGATRLTRLDNNFGLFDSNGNGPSLKYNGADFNAAQLTDGFVPVGAEQIAGGYQVALKNFSNGVFSIWNTDGNGNYLSYTVMAGGSPALQSLEPSFHQDLDGDGRIGVVTVIEAAGATSLTRVENNFYFYDSSGHGPSLKFGGPDLDARQLTDGYTPVGAEQIAGGYEVALKNSSNGAFSIWNTDGNGNYLSYTVLAGGSLALQSLESSFQQDLNGDGRINVVTVIDTAASTRLTRIDDNYYLYDGSGSGPSLKYNGAAWDATQNGPFVAVGAEQIAGGYLMAWKIPGTGQFSIWNADGNGNSTSYALMDGDSLALKSLEPAFHQDLNGDGFIGIANAVIESAGSTGFSAVNNHFVIGSGGSAVSLKKSGADFDAAQTGGFVPVGAEQIAGGYEVAWKNPNTDLYSIWTVDGGGNYISYAAMARTSAALQSLETSFQQDLNGDGTLVVETSGWTSFSAVNNHFVLGSGGSALSLKKFGADFDAAQTGGFVPVGAEQIAGGFEVAWKNPNTDLYSIWTVDSGGNYVSYAAMARSSAALQSLETSFQQDLNGDGTLVVDTSGWTSFTAVNNHFVLGSSGSALSLKKSGADFDAAQTGGFVPVGAEQIAGGYEVAWKNPDTDLYSIWTVDSGGNYISYAAMARTSAALQSLETSFQQDLNGDGTLVVETAGAIHFTKVDNHFDLFDGNGSGPSLKYNGADPDAVLLNGWAPVGAEQIAGGYEVAWKNPGIGLFSIWNTDSSGNYLSYTALAADGLALKLLEPSFQQDLNGDGRIGVVTTVIETAGAIHLTRLDDSYHLFDSNGSGPSLKYNGVTWDATQNGPFVPVGAELVPGGYVMAWKNPGTGQFSIWNADPYGNSTSYTLLDGGSAALQSLESSFHQDLNGDGMVGTLLIGDGNVNHLVGGAGNDSLWGNGGADILDGADGNDYLVGSAGGQSFIGGAGEDIVSYAFAAAGVEVHLGGPSLNTGEAAGDTYSGIEDVFGSQFADGLVGDGNANRLTGLAGNDELWGNGGADILDGGAGNDYLAGSDGGQTFIGGDGEDVVSYTFAASGVVANLATPSSNAGEAAGDTYSGIEDLYGSQFADTLVGDANANRLTGWGGNDTFVFNAALNAATNVDTITDFDTAFDTISLDRGVFTALAHTGALDAGAYFAGSAAHDADDRIIYNAATGALSYDADGNGGAAAIQFASLAANLNLTNAHFTVV